jgi:hypothetical protein
VDIYPDTLEDAKWTITSDVDLATATAEVEIGGVWLSLTWTGATTGTGPYSRIGKLTVEGADASGGVEVTAADARPLTRVTVGGEVLVRSSSSRFNVR